MEHLDGLARELTCSICLSVMEPPVARLPCCHYFCQECVTQSVRHKPQCPVCKCKVGRRDVSRDETMDRVVAAFAAVQAHREELVGGAALAAAFKDETQYFSPPPLLLGGTEPPSQPALLDATLLPAPASPAREGGAAAAAGEEAAAVGAGEEEHGQQAQQGAAGVALVEPLGKRSPYARAEAAGGGGGGSAAKRARRGEAGDGRGQKKGGGAGMELGDDGHRPLGWLRGVEDAEYQSPTASVTSSALDRLHGRCLEAPVAGARGPAAPPQARRLSLPSAHSSPAKQAEQAQQAEQAAERAEQERQLELLLAFPHKEEEEAAAEEGEGAAEQEQKENQPQGEAPAPAASKPAAGGKAAPGRRGGKQQKGGGSGGRGGPGGSQDITKWLSRGLSSQRKASAKGAAAEEGAAGPVEPGQAPMAATAATAAAAAAAAVPSPQQPGPDPQQREQQEAGEDPVGASLEPEALTSASPSGLLSPAGLSPEGLDKQLANLVEGLEEGQLTPPPAQLGAFQTSKVPGPQVAAPPALATAAAAAVEEAKAAAAAAGLAPRSSAGPAAAAAGGSGGGGGSGRRVPSRLVQWACEACTFLNEPQRRKCAMCTTPKPPTSRLAAAASAPAADAQQAQQPEGQTQERQQGEEERGRGEQGGEQPSPPQPEAEAQPGGGRGSAGRAALTEATPTAAGVRRAEGAGAPAGSSAKRAWLSAPGAAASGGSQRGGTCCAFCGAGADAGEECGELLEFELLCGKLGLAHEGCAKWAPNVYEDEAAPHGLANVGAEVARARTLHCTACGKGGAALGCAVKSCRCTYHLPCALEAEGTAFDQAAWTVHCPQHAKQAQWRGAAKPSRRRGSAAAGVAEAGEEQGPSSRGEEEEEEEVLGGEEGGQAQQAQQRGGSSKRRRVSAATGTDPGGSPDEGAVTRQQGQGQGPSSAAPASASARSRRSLTPAPAATAGTAGAARSPVWPAWQGPRKPGWVLLGSGLDERGKGLLSQLAAAAGASVARKWAPGVTHVVCGLVDGASRRTFKYMSGILSGKWVVGEGWLEACLREGRPAEEAPFLVARDTNGGEGGAAASRHSVGLRLGPLLDGYEIFLAGDFGNKEDVGALLKAAGARALPRPPSAAGGHSAPDSAPCTAFVLCEAPEGSSPQQAEQEHSTAGTVGADALRREKWYQRAKEAGVPVVSSKWLMDSVGSYSVQPLGGYAL